MDPASRKGAVWALRLGAAALSAAGLALAPAPAPAQADGGISVGEYHRVFPPAPVEVRAVREGADVVVSWAPPPVVATGGRLAYDPAVAGYRIYRVDGAGGRTLAGEVDAATMRFRDVAAGAAGHTYAVTAVQRSGQESGLSAAAEAPPP
jgi:hypothetical protein